MTWCVLGDLRRRVTGWLGLGLISAGCAAAFGQTDGFPRKLEVGCGDEPSCQQLVTEANARVSRCQPNTVGYIRCDDARADLQIAQGLLHEARERRRKAAGGGRSCPVGGGGEAPRAADGRTASTRTTRGQETDR